ncbi:MAG: DNA primase [Kiloniellales bacterium]|nr:DNA primase [Kiloniellales bacterium]
MSIPTQFLDEIRARLPLAEVVGRRVRLTKRGREHSGLCPFHNEKSPSFTVSEDKGFFHCFGCGAHGDVIGFVMRSEGLSFPEAVERLAGEAGLQVPVASPEERQRQRRQADVFEALERATAWFEAQLKDRAGAEARRYLEGRGLRPETIAAFRLGFAPDRRGALAAALKAEGVGEALLVEAGLVKPAEGEGQPRDYFFNRIVFPITDRRGRTIAFGGRAMNPQSKAKYLNSPDGPVFHKGRVLFNLARARRAAHDTGEIIVAEGYMDVIALAQAGFPAAVAPLGTAVTEAQIETLWRLAPEPVLCLDGDAAGQRAGLRVAERALPLLQPGLSLGFAMLPEGEDPDSLIARDGPEAFRAVLAAARPLSDLLWRKETEGRPLETPERQAGLAARLAKTLEAIRNGKLQAAYREDFARRFEAAFGYDPWAPPGRRWRRPAPGTGRGSRSGRGARVPGSSAPRLPLPGNLKDLSALKARQAQQLLATLVNHPSILAEVGEEVAEIRFSARDLEDFRIALLDFAAAQPELDSDAVKCHLSNQGFSAVLDRLLHRNVYRLAHFAGPDSSYDEARAAVAHILGLYRDREARLEGMKAQRELADEPDAEALARFQAQQRLLKESESQRAELERQDGMASGDVNN